MKSALSLALVGALVASAAPVATQGRTDATAGPIQRTAATAVFRLAAEELPPVSNAGRNRPGQADWSRVRDLQAAEVLLTLYGSPPAKRYVVRGTADDVGLTVLNLTAPNIPAEIRNALEELASEHADYLRLARLGHTVQLSRRVRLAGGDLFLDDRKVIELTQVVEDVTRSRIAEITRVRRGTRRGMAWGTLIGGGAGLALVLSSCGTNWNHETASCGSLDGALPLLGVVWGFGLGSALGATSRISTVIYRGPEDGSTPVDAGDAR